MRLDWQYVLNHYQFKRQMSHTANNTLTTFLTFSEYSLKFTVGPTTLLIPLPIRSFTPDTTPSRMFSPYLKVELTGPADFSVWVVSATTESMLKLLSRGSMVEFQDWTLRSSPYLPANFSKIWGDASVTQATLPITMTLLMSEAPSSSLICCSVRLLGIGEILTTEDDIVLQVLIYSGVYTGVIQTLEGQRRVLVPQVYSWQINRVNNFSMIDIESQPQRKFKFVFLGLAALCLPTTLLKPQYNLFVFAVSYWLWDRKQKVQCLALTCLSLLVDFQFVILSSVMWNSESLRQSYTNYHTLTIFVSALVFLLKTITIVFMVMFINKYQQVISIENVGKAVASLRES